MSQGGRLQRTHPWIPAHREGSHRHERRSADRASRQWHISGEDAPACRRHATANQVQNVHHPQLLGGAEDISVGFTRTGSLSWSAENPSAPRSAAPEVPGVIRCGRLKLRSCARASGPAPQRHLVSLDDQVIRTLAVAGRLRSTRTHKCAVPHRRRSARAPR